MRFLRKYSTNVFNELKSRGMIAQVTRCAINITNHHRNIDFASQRLQNVLETRKIALYAGVDPSAESLHVGNLAVLMALLHFHLHGHKVVPLVSH